MSKFPDAAQKKWWVTAAVIGVTVVGASLVMRPQAKPAANVSSADSSTSSGLVILPQHPLTFHALRLGGELVAASSLGGLSAIGGSEKNETVVWSVDGREVHRGEELDPSHFHRGSLVEARLQTVGPGGSASVISSAQVRVGNARPKIQSVTVQRDEDDPRWLQAHVRTIDADDDPLALQYTWTSNGEPVGRARGNRLLCDDIQPGQQISVEVTASDGELRSEPLRCKPFTIDNHAPTMSSPGTPRMERLDNGDLIAHMLIESQDADGDDLKTELIEAPPGFQWNEGSGQLSWTIASGDEAVDVTLRVTDARGASAQRTIRVRR